MLNILPKVEFVALRYAGLYYEHSVFYSHTTTTYVCITLRLSGKSVLFYLNMNIYIFNYNY